MNEKTDEILNDKTNFKRKIVEKKYRRRRVMTENRQITGLSSPKRIFS
jgi:hypothetical protein